VGASSPRLLDSARRVRTTAMRFLVPSRMMRPLPISSGMAGLGAYRSAAFAARIGAVALGTIVESRPGLDHVHELSLSDAP